MPTYEVTSPDGKTWEVNAPEGATQAQVLDYAKSQWSAQSKPAPAAVSAGSQLNQIPRQIGLTARYGLEGLGQTAEIVTEPIRQLITDPLARAAGVKSKSKPLSGVASDLADWIGLPSPQGANERVVADATRMVAGGGGMIGAANKAAKLPGLAGKVGTFIGQNPVNQLASAAGAGGAAGASREAGGSPGMQAVAGLVGGIAAPATLAGVRSIGKTASDTVTKLAAPQLVQQRVDNQINLTLRRAGVDWNGLESSVRAQVRQDVADALRNGDELSGDALRRLVEFRRVGATPTAGSISLDPVQITREKNLAKIGANSSDPTLQRLAQVENQNNATFIGNLNDAGAARGNVLNAGEVVTGAVTRNRDALRSAEQAAWEAARQSPGYRAPISAGVLSDANRALDEQGLMPFLDQRISNYMAAFQTGQRPFTPQDYRNLQSMLSKQMAAGGNEAAAAGVVRNILDQADMRPSGPINPGNLPMRSADAAGMRAADVGANDALDAVNQARAATRRAYAYEDSSPLVRSVLSDGASSDPARIAQRFVIGGTPDEARTLAGQISPEGRQVVRDALLSHLKARALNGAADEVGNFSQSAFNKELSKIGERKLALFFSPEEIRQLQALGRVSSYTQFQPRGSAVNNSNSGALLGGIGLDFLSKLASRAPLGLNDTITGVINGSQARQAMTPGRGLLTPQAPTSFADAVGPQLLLGTGLLAPQVVPNR